MAREVVFTLMALGQVSGCKGKKYNAVEIMAEGVREILSLEADLAAANSLRAAAEGEVERLKGEVLKFRTAAGARQQEIERLTGLIEYHKGTRR